ncbi:MAG: efflux RND transporter permease subunit [Lachnospiraceae bacterium]|nr:efflux RND transporter permease subunit [Lachnospiraceae bacterium]
MISKFSVKKPYTVLVGVVLAIVLGIVSFTKMTTDLLPSISLPYIIVMTTYPGASPETVEMVVTKPVEASMATVSNIQSVSSMSSENYSIVILEFAQSADMNAISLEIRENLDQITSYWDESVGNPIIMKLNPDMLPVMIAAVGVDGMEHAEISQYVQETIMPELESIEGVASVSADGLLEEQINVIIRQEKVDELNEKIYAAIDEKMEEAAQEIADGKQKLEDGEKELADGKAEIVSGQQELNDGKKEIEDGEKELEQKKKETIEELAKTKNELLTAKASLEATKMTITTGLATAEGYQTAINNMVPLLEVRGKYGDAYDRLQNAREEFESVSDSDSSTTNIDNAKKEIENLKKSYVDNSMMQTLASSEENLGTLITTLKNLDWCSEEDHDAVVENMTMLDVLVGVSMLKMEGDLSNATQGLGLEAYKVLMNQTMVTVNDGLNKVNQGLVEIEKGEMTAAIEFSNASMQLALGKMQMESAQAQLDAALEQINAGQDQMEEAKEQLEDGEKQFEDAREDAYKQADMTEILTVDTIKGLLTAQNFSMPAGYVTEAGVDYLVRVGDKPDDIEDLKKLPLMDLHMDGVPVITLADVADVFYTDNSATTYTNVNGSVGCMLTIQKQTGYSTGEVSDLLGERFKELMETEEGLTIITLMDQGIFIDLVMDSIINNVLFGGLLAILILIVFLKDLRPTMVVACSIPVSLVTAIVCMYFSGVTLNVISLSGLALGIGMLVDNSIVVIENIYRLRSEGYSMRDAAIEGTREVGGAIVASTLTTVCVFLPIVFTEGITRQLFVDMGLTIAYSLFASLLIAMTVVPAMASKMLNKTKSVKDGKFFTGLVKVYSKLLGLCLKAKSLVIILALALLVISIAAAWTNGTAFMSDMDSTQLTVTVTLPEEAKLEDTAALTNQVVERILEIEDVQNVGAMLSSTTMSTFTGGGGSTNSTTIYVVAYDDKTMTNEEIADIIEAKTEDLDAEIAIQTSSMDMSALGGSGISIQVRGRDIDTLQDVAKELAAIIETVEGTAEVSDGLAETGVELRITVDKEKAISNGLTVAQVFTQIAPKLAEASVATTLEASDKDYSVYVESGKDTELTRELVKELTVKGTDAEGKSVEIPLADIVEFSDAMSLDTINRVDNTRYVTVSAAIAEGYNVGRVATAVEQKLKNYEVPDGCKLVFAGENETINDALGQVGLMLVLAIVFMYLIMVAQFQSLKSPFIILFTIPLAFTGGFLGLFFSGSEISVIAMIGFVMLSGVIVNNGIVIVDYMNQLREGGMSKREAIIEAGKTRMRPVLMTALTTILALSTMVFSNDMGSEMAKPMSVVTIGGLSYGTLLTLIVIPCIYDLFNPERKKKGGVIEAVDTQEDAEYSEYEEVQETVEYEEVTSEETSAEEI